MAPKRQGSFLTRGRQRVQQTKQMKQSSARQLPPKGGTGANKPKATAQRAATAVRQKVTQDIATLRALGENMKRNQARAERQIPADRSPSVRRVGPGGANPKPQGQLPPGKRGGQIQQKGGPLARQNPSGRTAKGRVEQVRVREIQPAQLSGTNPRSLPPATRRPTRASIGNVSGPASNPKPPGTNTSLKPGGNYRAPRVPLLDRALLPLAIMGQTTNVVDGFKDLANHPFLNKNKDQTQPRGDRRTNLPGGRSNRSSQPQRPANQYETLFDPGRDTRASYGLSDRNSQPSTSRTANDGQRTRLTEQRRAVGTVPSTPQPRQSSTRPSQAAPRTSTGTAGTGRKWEDFNKGRGTSETNNPLIKNDSWLMNKVKEREDKMASNVGPAKSGTDYAASKQAADVVARRKKKEEEDKKKAQQ